MERNGWIVGALVAAAAVVVIGLGAVFFRDDTTVISDQPETTTTAVPAVSEDTIATIEGFLAATDLDTLTVYLTDEAFAGNERVSGSPNASELLVAREILGRETEVVSCIEAGGETIIRCTVSTRSNVTEALGLDPLLSDITFNFTDDLIGTWPSMGWGGFTLSREVAIDAGFREDFDQVCGGDNLVDAECAEFVMANIDSWVGGEALPEE